MTERSEKVIRSDKEIDDLIISLRPEMPMKMSPARYVGVRGGPIALKKRGITYLTS